jgi:hypothetical protein
MKSYLEKFGSVGAIVAAAACPLCFPKLALIGAFFGLGAFAAYETQLLIAALALVALAVAGHVVSYFGHRNRWLLGSAVASGAAVFAGVFVSEILAYAGLAGLVAASSADLWRRFARKRALLESEIACPKCGFRRTESMAKDACQIFYECTGCGALLRPRPGDCCVFCSYGSVKCPPAQLA